MLTLSSRLKWCKLHLGSNDEGNVSVITDIFLFVVYNENTLFIYHDGGAQPEETGAHDDKFNLSVFLNSTYHSQLKQSCFWII